MAFVEWIQANYIGILQVVGLLIGAATAITGLFSSEGATGAKAVFLKISAFLSAVTPKDAPGSLSVPLTNINIEPKP